MFVSFRVYSTWDLSVFVHMQSLQDQVKKMNFIFEFAFFIDVPNNGQSDCLKSENQRTTGKHMLQLAYVFHDHSLLLCLVSPSKLHFCK